jgi:hypothetical protein
MAYLTDPASGGTTMKTATIALLTGILCIPTMADAASPKCGPRTEVLSQLAKKYSEVPAAIGLASSGALIEVLTSDDGATWTILVSRPNGTSCLVAAGEEWHALEPVAASRDLGT